MGRVTETCPTCGQTKSTPTRPAVEALSVLPAAEPLDQGRVGDLLDLLGDDSVDPDWDE